MKGEVAVGGCQCSCEFGYLDIMDAMSGCSQAFRDVVKHGADGRVRSYNSVVSQQPDCKLSPDARDTEAVRHNLRIVSPGLKPSHDVEEEPAVCQCTSNGSKRRSQSGTRVSWH